MSSPVHAPTSRPVTSAAFLIAFLPSVLSLPFIIASGMVGPTKFLETCNAVAPNPVLVANEAPPVIGATSAATTAVGSVVISIAASLTKPKNCFMLPKSALSNSFLK